MANIVRHENLMKLPRMTVEDFAFYAWRPNEFGRDTFRERYEQMVANNAALQSEPRFLK